uniref:Ovule protein n=1 Tax=Heterorhabditis bacteriophora TaxID=37862 RepID=A0A1I7XKL5_HETBA
MENTQRLLPWAVQGQYKKRIRYEEPVIIHQQRLKLSCFYSELSFPLKQVLGFIPLLVTNCVGFYLLMT